MATAKCWLQGAVVIKVLPLLASCLLSGLCLAQPLESSHTIGMELAARFAAVQSWRGEFEQLLVDINGREQQRVTGHFALQQPNLIDWYYSEPLNQRLVSDGATLWFYDRDLEQVTVRPVAELLAESPAAILLGKLPAPDLYTFSYAEPDIGSGAVIERYTMARTGEGSSLTMGQVQELTLDWRGDELLTLRVTDNFGHQTTVSFKQLNRGAKLPASQFNFVVPRGVEVVR